MPMNPNFRGLRPGVRNAADVAPVSSTPYITTRTLGDEVPAMAGKPGGLPRSNAPVPLNPQVLPMSNAPGGGGPFLIGAPNMPSAPLPPGAVYKKGGKVSASKRADGIAQRGKTRGKIY